MKRTGVYAIRCTANGKLYVGSAAVSIEKRWLDHRWFLRNSRHANRHLQAAWNHYGEEAFEFLVLEECEAEECIAREQHWINELQPTDRTIGYNVRKKADSNLGLRHTEESRASMSAAQRRWVRKKETYDKIAAALKGRKHNPEVCARMSAGQMGKKHSEATKIKMAATRKGQKRDEACRKAISEGQHRKNFAQGKRGVYRIVMPSGNVRYHAVLSINRKKTNLGYFLTEQEANNVYDTAWLKQFGPLSPEVSPAKEQPLSIVRKLPMFSFMADDED